jgi:hypothetical protein
VLSSFLLSPAASFVTEPAARATLGRGRPGRLVRLMALGGIEPRTPGLKDRGFVGLGLSAAGQRDLAVVHAGSRGGRRQTFAVMAAVIMSTVDVDTRRGPASRGSPRRAELPDRAEGRTRPLRAHRGLPRRSAGPAGRPTPRPPPPGDDRQHNGISPCLPARTTAKSTSRFRTGALTSRCAARTSTRIGTPNPAASPPAPRAAGYSPAAPRSWDLGHDQDDERYLTRGVWSPGADPEDTPNPENPLRLAGRPGDCSPPTAAPRGRRPEPAATAPPASSG